MVKKILIVVAVAGAVALAVPAVRDHAGRAVAWARSEAEESVPLEYQLERAEKELREIEPEIHGARQVVAAEEVEIEELERDLQHLEREHETDISKLRERTDALRAVATTELVVAGRSYSRERLAQDVAIALERHERRGALLESRRQTVLARSKSLEAARERLENMVAERDRMALAIDELRALWRENQALEMARGTHRFDDTRLADVAQRLEGIRKKLKVQRRVIEQSDPVLGQVRGTAVDPETVVERAEAYLRTVHPETPAALERAR